VSRKGALKLIVALAVFAVVGASIYLRNTREAEPGLTDLPEGVIAQINTFQITAADLDAHLASLPEKQRDIKSKDLEGALEYLIEKRILLAEAKKLPEKALPDTEGMDSEESEEALLEALRKHIVEAVKVPEKDIRAYYEGHKSEYEGQPGSSYGEMHDSIADYLRYDLVDEAFGKYRESLIAQAKVEKNRVWITKVRAELKDPLAETRGSGKVVVADFGRGI
jgi:hypothetical protein